MLRRFLLFPVSLFSIVFFSFTPQALAGGGGNQGCLLGSEEHCTAQIDIPGHGSVTLDLALDVISDSDVMCNLDPYRIAYLKLDSPEKTGLHSVSFMYAIDASQRSWNERAWMALIPRLWQKDKDGRQLTRDILASFSKFRQVNQSSYGARSGYVCAGDCFYDFWGWPPHHDEYKKADLGFSLRVQSGKAVLTYQDQITGIDLKNIALSCEPNSLWYSKSEPCTQDECIGWDASYFGFDPRN